MSAEILGRIVGGMLSIPYHMALGITIGALTESMKHFDRTHGE